MAITLKPYGFGPETKGIQIQSASVRVPDGAATVEFLAVVPAGMAANTEYVLSMTAYRSTDGGQTFDPYLGPSKGSGDPSSVPPAIAGGVPGQVHPDIRENWRLHEYGEEVQPQWGNAVSLGFTPQPGWHVACNATPIGGSDSGVAFALVAVARDANGAEMDFDTSTLKGR